MGKLLSIETGFTCNSRCTYCTQLDYRVIPQADRLDLSTEEIKERIRYAAENGYAQLGFSGGEPTIRSDFVELITYARTFPFERIGVTTNGRMFAYKQFTEQAMRAGLDGFTFSLHGHTPELHDKAIAKAPGALEQALQGLRHIDQVKKRFGLEAHLMNNQILLPENTPWIKEMVELLGPLGVSLFMIQPFISQRSNVDDLGRFFVPYDDIVAAVERALPALARYNARVKPYNVPNCLLWRFGDDNVERQFYPIRSFREYEQKNPGEFRAFKAKQWYRIDACKTCEEYCPGFRIEQYPQQRMADDVVATAAEFAAGVGRKREDPPLLLSGLELLESSTIDQVLERLKEAHGPAGWLSALCERVPRRELADLLCDLYESGRLAELVLVTQPLDQRFLAQRVLEKGNLEELRAGLFMLGGRRKKGRTVPPLRVLFNVGDLVRLLDDPVVSPQWPLLCKALDKASGRGTPDHQPVDAIIAISNFPRDSQPPDMRRQRNDNLALAKRLSEACIEAGMRPLLATLGDRRGLDAARAREMAEVESQFAEVLPVESWADRLFRHPFSQPEMDFVSWSPPWLFERWDLTGDAVPEGLPQQGGDTVEGGIRTVAVDAIAG